MNYDFEDREMEYTDRIYQNPVSLEYDGELKDILMLLTTAGADVHTRNDLGESPSDIARSRTHWREWSDALTECGYDLDEAGLNAEDAGNTCWTSSTDRAIRIVQPKLLSLDEYLEIRRERLGEFTLKRVVEVGDSEFDTEDNTCENGEGSDASESEYAKWFQDDELGTMDAEEEEESEPEDDLGIAGDSAGLGFPYEALYERPKKKAD